MKKILKIGIKQTIPVLIGYLVLGIAFGLLLQKAGYGYGWAFLMSLCIYAGSMQFVLITLLQGGVGLVAIIVTTLSVNFRHMFYGISFLEKFKGMGKKRLYMIFSLTDETYSLLCSIKPVEGVNENQLLYVIALLNHIYWIIGSVLGNILGNAITFNTNGIDFAMTALFVVIFVEQWLSTKNHMPSIIGLACGIIYLIVLGPESFLLPSLVSSVVLLLLLKEKGKLMIEDGGNNHE